MKLSAKQQAFVDEYLVDFNATQAAIRAGYSKKAAQVQGSRLLSNAMVQRAIEARQTKRAARLDISVDRIEQELARIAFSDMRRYAQWGPTKTALESTKEAEAKAMVGDNGELIFGPPPNGVMLLSSEALTDDEAAAVSQVTEECKPGATIKYGIKLYDKVKALELLGKRHGMWEENINLKTNFSWVDVVQRRAATKRR